MQAARLSTRIIDNLTKLRASVQLDEIWDQFQKQNIQMLTWDDDTYQIRLRDIDNPPPVQYFRGNIETNDEWAVASVGTRRITLYGRQVAERIIIKLANIGITVVRGLALGVDTVAHQSSLDAGGRTLAVYGSGVDRIYPPTNHNLAEKMIVNGARSAFMLLEHRQKGVVYNLETG